LHRNTKRTLHALRSNQHRQRSTAQLHSLTHTPQIGMSGEFRESRCSLPIHLHPSRLANVREGVEEHINALLMKYDQIMHTTRRRAYGGSSATNRRVRDWLRASAPLAAALRTQRRSVRP